MTYLCYLAAPIDQAGPEVYDTAMRLTRIISDAGLCIYRPMAAWSCGGELDPRVEQVNQQALRRADLLVAYLAPEVPTIGVPLEMAEASQAGIPCVVLSPVKSYALAGRPQYRQVATVPELLPAIWDALAQPRNTNELRFVLHDGTTLLPSRAYPDDAGVDLHTMGDHEIPPGTFLDVPTTVAHVQLPTGTWGMVTGRSSTLRKRKLFVPVGVADEGWRGPLLVGVWNLGSEPVKVLDGDRLGQFVVVGRPPYQIARVDRVDPHPRGLNGFGSSG